MTRHSEYHDKFVAGLQHMWGRGFLSPGGREEVAKVLQGLSLADCRVLDIGCGLGAIDVLLVEEHHAKSVVCIDVEPQLIEQARTLQASSNVAHLLDFKQVEPGPLPFQDNQFDVVFSKDAIVHIEDKNACYQEIARVLKPQGVFATSDWFGSGDAQTLDMTRWLEAINLTFSLGTIEQAADRLRHAGLEPIRMLDRNQWYLDYMAQELGSISGDNYTQLVELVGEIAARQRVLSSKLKQKVLAQGQLRPGHLQAINRKRDATR